MSLTIKIVKVTLENWLKSIQFLTYLGNIQQFNDKPVIILTKTDKKMGWRMITTSWFNKEYTRQLSDVSTYRQIDNFDLNTTVQISNTLLNKLKLRLDKLLNSLNKKKILQPVNKKTLQVPYMKLLPKLHKPDAPACTSNLDKLTRGPIITAHSWVTGNISRLLCT